MGSENLYVVTADPDLVFQRCRAAGATVVQEPYAPDYDPSGTMFTVSDPDGNLWPFAHSKGAQNDGRYADADKSFLECQRRLPPDNQASLAVLLGNRGAQFG